MTTRPTEGKAVDDDQNDENTRPRPSDYDHAGRRAIEIAEKALGKDHPRVATAYNNLAVLLQDQGKPRQSRSIGGRSRFASKPWGRRIAKWPRA